MESSTNLVDFYSYFANSINNFYYGEHKITPGYVKKHVTINKEVKSLNFLRIVQLDLSGQYFGVLNNVLEDYPKLRVLRLEFCSLQSENITMINNILKTYTTIKELSVSGNPNEEQNFYLLLENNSVTHLSLRFCQITDTGIKKITEEFNKQNNCILLHLNLSSNLFGEEGLVLIADMLRSNRTLISINLADNVIDDKGCILLFEPLKQFSLRHSEIVDRRRRRYKYFRERMALMKQHKINVKKDNKISSPQKVPSKRNQSMKNSSRGSSVSLNKQGKVSRRQSAESENLRIMNLIDNQIEHDQHPFVSESYQKDKNIFCRGNFHFQHYNLSYNKITNEGLVIITETIKYQKDITLSGLTTKGGLSHIQLVGNGFDPNNQLVKDIYTCLPKRIKSGNSKSSFLSLKDSKKSMGSRKRSFTR